VLLGFDRSTSRFEDERLENRPDDEIVKPRLRERRGLTISTNAYRYWPLPGGV